MIKKVWFWFWFILFLIILCNKLPSFYNKIIFYRTQEQEGSLLPKFPVVFLYYYTKYERVKREGEIRFDIYFPFFPS